MSGTKAKGPSTAWLDRIAESGVNFPGEGERGATLLERDGAEYEVIVRRVEVGD